MAPVGDIFAIGDIHGCAEELDLLLEKLPLTAQSTVVFLGDYVDRGLDSHGVIETILALKKRCHVVTLMGNHDEMFLDFLADPESPEAAMFIFNGGSATLASYADERGRVDFPVEHRQFFHQLELFYQTAGYFFCHAGVPDVPLEHIDPVLHRKHLLYIRAPFHNSTFDWSRRIIHGHTPTAKVEQTRRRINLDTGCVNGNRLTAMQLPTERIYEIPKRRPDEPVFLREHSGSRRRAARFSGAVPVSVECHGRRLNFVTHDYSEFGMQLRSQDAGDLLLQMGEHITGIIEVPGYDPITFAGTVVRVKLSGPVRGYAVMLERVDESDLPVSMTD